MAVTLTNFGTYTWGGHTESIVISGAPVGALLIIIAYHYSPLENTVNTPSGWTLVSTLDRSKIFTRIKQSGDSETINFTKTGTDTWYCVPMIGFAANSTIGSISIIGERGNSNYAGNLTIPSVTHPNSNPALAIAFAGSRFGLSDTHTYSTGGWTRQIRTQEAGGGNNAVVSLGIKDLPTGGASGTTVVGNSTDMQGFIFTLQEVAPTITYKVKVGGAFQTVTRRVKVNGSFYQS